MRAPVTVRAIAGGPAASSRLAADFGQLQNLKSGKYLHPLSIANGAKVVQRSYDGTGIQEWTSVRDGNYCSFENYGAGRNLGIDGASTAVGAAAIIANGSGDTNQDWERITYNGGEYFAFKNRKSGLCLGVSGASTAENAQVAQFRCDGSANQGWSYA
ncbi:RICIN domain-containing protein [Streptomyces sp. JNUCC 63]